MQEGDFLAITTLRMLSLDQVEAAASGHPGLPLGAAPMAYALWQYVLRHNPANPRWVNRDRFILSAGHGSALLYSLLHLYGYGLPLEELRRFRQWGSRTPGHPEYGLVPGVEATTGPLGQGFAMGVGMALAERVLAGLFNRPGFPLVDHYTYAIVSDGDLEEGVASEAASFAGAHGLGKLIYLYDSNGISIEGSVDRTFREDVRKRFEAYGWQTLLVTDGEDVSAILHALGQARADQTRPTLIEVRTTIGRGSPRQGTAKAHSEPFPPEEVRATRRHYGWPEDLAFHVPDAARERCAEAGRRGAEAEARWQELLSRYRTTYPAEARLFETILAGQLPEGWDEGWPSFTEGIATREASHAVLQVLAERLPHLVGGSADLAPSTRTWLEGYPLIPAEGGRNIAFGVREHAMAAMVNGMALHGGLLPYGATFLVFSDYARPALRLAALMGVHSIFVFTHDSVAVGEDGPTHQPVEHLMALRAIPGLTVLRPADGTETAGAWHVAISRRGPVALILTRQKVPLLDETRAAEVARGAYVLWQSAPGRPEAIIIATGSEVHLALAAARQLAERGRVIRVVSMPSWELFQEQPEHYRQEVLPPEVHRRVAVEAGVTLGWERYVGERGKIVGIDRFGASAPGAVVLQELGVRTDRVVAEVAALLEEA